MGLNSVKIMGGDTNANTLALAAALQASTVQSKLFNVHVSTTNVAAGFIQVFDSATTPADTSVPLISWPIAATGAIDKEWGLGRRFTNGIWIGNSTTQATKTAGAANCIIDVVFRKER